MVKNSNNPAYFTRRLSAYTVQKILSSSLCPDDMSDLEEFRSLPQRDRNLTYEIVMGTLRNLLCIDAILESVCTKPLKLVPPFVLSVLRISCYQILYLNKVPAYAVLNEANEIIKREGYRKLSGFANAVLRKISKSINEINDLCGNNSDAEGLALKYSHPYFLVKKWLRDFDKSDVVEWLKRANQPPKYWAVINSEKISRDDFIYLCKKADVKAEPVSWSSFLCSIDSSPYVVEHLIDKGFCFIQDINSHAVLSVLPRVNARKILDLCGAPGGKSMVLALKFPDAEIISADISFERAGYMKRRLAAYEYSTVAITVSDGHFPPFRENSFDVVLLDAPCSGSGTLQKNPDIRWRITQRQILQLARIQADLIKQAAKLVKPNGLLVYVTCSVQREENHMVVEEFLRLNRGMFRIVPPSGEIGEIYRTPEDFFQTFPKALEGEGFFSAILQKLEE